MAKNPPSKTPGTKDIICEGFQLTITRGWNQQPEDYISLRVLGNSEDEVGLYRLPQGNITDVPDPALVSQLLRKIASKWPDVGWTFHAKGLKIVK